MHKTSGLISLLVAGSVLANAVTASAQPVPPAPEAPAPDPAVPTPAPEIATPAPGASADKVEEAKDVAEKAELTPIVPSPGDVSKPAFQLYAEIDIPVVAVGLVFAAARLVKTQKAYCAPTCDEAELNNGLDRFTAGQWSPGWSSASDYALYGLAGLSVGLLLYDEGLLPSLNDGVVLFESVMSATAIASIMTIAAGRPRPFLYGDPTDPDSYEAPLSQRNSANAGLSFLSSHTAMAFALATSLYVTQRRLHPNGNRSKWVLGVGLGVASFVGAARVMSGFHFITDVAGGAVVGSSVGVLISSIHKSPVSVVPIVNDTTRGAAIQATF